MSNPDLYQQAIEVQALIRCAMLAEENDTSGIEHKGTAHVLCVAARMMEDILDGIETMQRREWKEAGPARECGV